MYTINYYDAANKEIVYDCARTARDAVSMLRRINGVISIMCNGVLLWHQRCQSSDGTTRAAMPVVLQRYIFPRLVTTMDSFGLYHSLG